MEQKDCTFGSILLTPCPTDCPLMPGLHSRQALSAWLHITPCPTAYPPMLGLHSRQSLSVRFHITLFLQPASNARPPLETGPQCSVLPTFPLLVRGSSLWRSFSLIV